MKKFISLVQSAHFQMRTREISDLFKLSLLEVILELLTKFLFLSPQGVPLLLDQPQTLDLCICESHILPDYFPFFFYSQTLSSLKKDVLTPKKMSLFIIIGESESESCSSMSDSF